MSRIDVLVDELLEKQPDADARALRGKVAIANAKLAYQRMSRIFGTRRWEALHAKGARIQRLLWASTSTKNPDYPDLVYVEPLIGRMTVNTMTEQTIEALLDHGRIAADTVKRGLDDARRVVADDLDRVAIRYADAAASSAAGKASWQRLPWNEVNPRKVKTMQQAAAPTDAGAAQF